MSAEEHIAKLRRALEEARSVPMSASVMVNKADLLAVVDALSAAVRDDLAAARAVESDRDAVVAGGRREADQLVAKARDAQGRMASDTEVLRLAREQADEALERARQQAETLRNEADDYVDAKLAGFEIALTRTLQTVRRGRERLAGQSELDALSSDDVDEIKLPGHLDR